MSHTPPIETCRLMLTNVCIKDAEEIYGYVKNPNVLRYTTGTPPREFSETLSFVTKLANSPEGTYVWAIRKKEHPEVIGVVEFGISEDGTKASLDYAISEDFWNQGIMTEAGRAVLKWGFTSLDSLQEVTSAAMTRNPASTRVQEKCGMRPIRMESRQWEKFDEPVEIIVCGITREEYFAAPPLPRTATTRPNITP